MSVKKIGLQETVDEAVAETPTEPKRVELSAGQAVRMQDAFTQYDLARRRLASLTAAVAKRDGYFTLDVEGDKVFLVEVPDE
jgi:hypothetical protein